MLTTEAAYGGGLATRPDRFAPRCRLDRVLGVSQRGSGRGIEKRSAPPGIELMSSP